MVENPPILTHEIVIVYSILNISVIKVVSLSTSSKILRTIRNI